MWLMTMKMYESDVVPHSILLLQLPLLVEACTSGKDVRNIGL